MSLINLLTIGAAGLNTFLGLFVLARAPHGRVQRAFACFALSVGIWVGSNAALAIAPDARFARDAANLTFFGSNLIAATMCWFGAVFPGTGQQIRPGLQAFIFCGVFLAAPALAGIYTPSVQPKAWGWELEVSPLCYASWLYLVATTLFFFSKMVSRWRGSSGMERLQVQYILLGTSLSFSIGIFTNLVMPLFFKTARFAGIGAAGSLFFVMCAGYSIAKFRLLDIPWVLQQGAAYGLTLTGLALIFILTVGILDRQVASVLNPTFIGRKEHYEAFVAMALAICFQPLHRFFHKLVSIVFFRRGYDYPKTLRSVSRSMTSMLDLQQLREHLASSIIESMQVESAVLSPRRFGESEAEEIAGGVGQPYSPALLHCMWRGRIVLREEVAQDERDPQSQHIAANMTRLRADVALPLIFKDELIGILLVGPKRSGTVFTDQDIALLSTLANQAAIALRNAQLYHEVHTSQQYTQAILEHLDSAVLTVGPNEKIVVANEAAKTLLPSPNGSLILPPTLRSAVKRVFETLEEQADIEFDLLNASDTVTPVVATVSPFLTETGRVENVLLIIRDITVLRRLEDERLRAERLSSATRVAATLAHEIRNPLASIKTFCQLLPEKYLDVEFREGFSQLALQEVDRIDALVSNLLVSGRSTKGKWEPVGLDQVVHSILQFIQPLMMEHGLRLEYRCEDALPSVMGDASQLRQLFLNLLLNARQAAPDDSAIEVCLFGKEDGRVVGTVHNGGTPISSNDLPHLFDPFFTTHEHGTGLGLTVCKQVTEYHRGELKVESSELWGTTFSLSLPSAGGFA